MDTDTFDSAAFRKALGSFATGVAVATTRDAGGNKVGITISSFNSVSLQPPLVLFSIGKTSSNYETFANVDSFAINILSDDQEAVCRQFSAQGTDKFAGLDTLPGIDGVPLLADYAACFECRLAHCYDGGDHSIIVGEVIRFDDREKDPLIFYRGHFLHKAQASGEE